MNPKTIKNAEIYKRLKVLSFKIHGEIILKPIADRLYEIAETVRISVYLADGRVVVYTIKKGFRFDGRSGGMFGDLFVPNLGTQLEIACWLIHDANGYGLYLDFTETNDMLYGMLVCAGRTRSKAWMVRTAVSLDNKWYGIPNPESPEYRNIKPPERYLEAPKVFLK